MKKTVLLPIIVPSTRFCWDGKENCSYFDSTGGHATCDLRFDPVEDRESGFIMKDCKCHQLRRKP